MIPETALTGTWLADGADSKRYLAAVAAERERVHGLDESSRAKGVVVSEADPVRFCAILFAGLAENLPIWLRPPFPSQDDDRRFSEILNLNRKRPAGSLFVATGGTSGGLRFARHSWKSMEAAALCLHRTVGSQALQSWCCLPLRHVAGFMQVVRAVVTGGDVFFGQYRDLTERNFPRKRVAGRLVSLVPTQLARLLTSSNAVANLQTAETVFVGGGPLHPELAERAREADLPVAPTYGTTETAGMVTMLSPELFLSGQSGVGSALPEVELTFSDSDVLRIRSSGLCLGYHDHDFEEGAWLQTSDAAFWGERGSLQIEGRRDRLVNTGGVKVDPAKIEGIILETGLVRNCFVAGISDPEWGEKLVAFCTPASANTDAVKVALTDKLEASHVPKIVLSMDRLPFDELGKPDGAAMSAAVAT